MRAFTAASPGVRAVLMVAGTSLFVVLVAWATLLGPDEVFTGPGVPERTPQTTTRTCLPVDVTTAPDGSVATTTPDNPRGLPLCPGPDTSRRDATDIVERADPPWWVKLLVWTFLVAVAATMIVLVAFVVVVAVRDLAGRRAREPRRAVVEFATLGDPARLLEAITHDASEQDAVLRGGDPRNAIVAAWLRFEVQGDSAGIGRRPWETSSEYALRILDLVAADSGAVNRLAGLYREARFSEHPITEDHRAEALAALAAVRHSLGVRT